jgi:hypothetical protein
VIKALDATYRQLGIEVKPNSPATGEVGNRRFEKMHRVGNVPLSEYFGCGDTLMGPAADSYSLTISLVSQVTGNGSASTVRTTAAARAQNMTSSNGAVACESRGTLETKLADTLREILRKGTP